MHAKGLVLLFSPLVLLVRAGVEYDLDDAPRACRDLCRPINQLSDDCGEVDLGDDDDDDDDDTEDLLEWQCFCTNDSFDVARIAALCADCMQQNLGVDNDDDDDDDEDDNDDDDLEDISEIMYRCGFSSTTYATTASAAAADVTVFAAVPTASSQLTTTITGTSRAPGVTDPSSSDDINNGDNGTGAGDGTDENAATTLRSGFGLGLIYIVAATVAGAMVIIC